MPAANIKINGVAASVADAPIDTLVNLDNVNVGGEATYLWEFVDQPDGAADAFSNAALQSPTFTPKKEGTYLIRLTVNQGGGVNEKVDVKAIRILHLKVRLPAPAAGETTQFGADGWKDEQVALNATLVGLFNRVADPMVFVGVNNIVGSLPAGTPVVVDSRATIKTGLPGEELVPGLAAAQASIAELAHVPIAIVDGPVKVGDATTFGHLLRCRMSGVAPTTIAIPGGVTVGLRDPVWLSDAGAASLVPGTFPRRIGRVIEIDVPGAKVYWTVDAFGGSGRRAKINPATYDDFGGTGWARQTIGAIFGWGTTLAAATDLVVGLDVAVGELLHKVSVRVKQASGTGLIDINLCQADASGAEVVLSTVTTDNSTVNKDVAVPMPVDATRAFDFVEILAQKSYYLRMNANGNNGSLRIVGATDTTILPPGSKPN